MNVTTQRKPDIPKLRFPGFNGRWNLAKVKTFAPLQRGFDLTNGDTVAGKYPVVFSNGILKTHNEHRAKGPGVVTGRSGTIGKVTFVEGDYWPHNTSLWVTDFSKTHAKFVYYFYLKLDLTRFKAGSTVPTLNRNDVHDYLAAIPSIPEQRKIADFLTAVDRKIGYLIQKKALLEDYKKGVMQQLFTQAIRFKDDHGNDFPDWEDKKLGEVSAFINGRAYKQNELLSEGIYPVLRVGNFFTNPEWYYSDLDLPEDKYCDTGDLLYAWSASFGPRIWNGGKVIYHYHIWKVIPSKKISKLFLFHLLDWDVERIKNAQGNGIAMIHVTKGAIEERPLKLPSLPEQTKIADFLSSLDRKIESVATQITETQTFKRGLLQQMFI